MDLQEVLNQTVQVSTPLRHGAHTVVATPLPICITRRNLIPPLVRPFLMDGWLVGSGAKFLTLQQHVPPRDWDVLVPTHRWDRIQHLLTHSSFISSHIGGMGGFQLQSTDGTLDLWAGDIDTYMARLTRNESTQTAIRLPLELVLVRAAHGQVGHSDGSNH